VPGLRVTESYRWREGKLQEVLPSLADNRWELVEVWGRPVTVSPLPHLSFGADQRAKGFGGCNQLDFSYKATNKAIRFDGVSGGQKYCADTPEEDLIGALIQIDRYDWKGP